MDKHSAEGSPLLGREQRAPKACNFDGNMFADESFSRGEARRYRRKSAIAGVVMFVLAGAGLLAMFNAIQSARTPQSSTTLQELGEDISGSRSERLDAVDGSGAPRNSVETPSANVIAGVSTITGSGDKNSALPRSSGVGEASPKEASARSPFVEDEGQTGSSTTGVKPNVFFIMVDDMGWNDIGYQSTDLHSITPNLDKLAAGGVKMDQYYSMSICTPSRASLMTGRYPVRYGLQYNVIQPGAPWGLPLTEKLMPEYLNNAGYESHMVGKWHIGSYTHEHTPNRRGFETFLGYLNDEEMYWTHQSWTATYHGRKFFDFGFGNQTDYYDIIDRFETPTRDDDDTSVTYTGPTSSMGSSTRSFKGEYSTTVFQERAMEIVSGKTPFDERPLFLYLAHQAVHDPLGVPPMDAFSEEEIGLLDELELATMDSLRLRFAKVLLYMDKTIGELVTYLEDEGWMENSIIVVASDNGGCHTKGGDNYPLRGIKHSYWEGGNRVPAFVYSKSHLPEDVWGTTYDGIVHVTDWLPTLASAAGFDITGNAGVLDGVDQWDHFTGALVNDADGMGARTEMLYNFDTYILWTSGDSVGMPDYPLAQGAFRQGKWKLMLSEWCAGYYTFDTYVLGADADTNGNTTCQDMGTCSDCGMSCVGTANYTDWLFDLETDPREQYNVIEQYPEIAYQMHQRMTELVFREYANSSYVDINRDAYAVWAESGWWMVPWYSSTDSSSTSSTSSDDDVATTTSWTSSVSSSNPTQ